MTDTVRAILSEYREGLSSILGDELERLVLYGSQARGDAIEGSDIDVLCVIRGPFDYGNLIERTSALTAQISLKYDVAISRAFSTKRDYETAQTPFLMNVRKEGTVL